MALMHALKTVTAVGLLSVAGLLHAAGTTGVEPQRHEATVMKLYRVILPVTDIDAAERFYARLVGDTGERVSPGRHYFNLGGAILALYDPVADGDAMGEGWRHHENQYIYLAVNGLEAAVERALEAGADALSERIESMPWGERLFYFRDPFGNPVCLVDETTAFLGGTESGEVPQRDE